MEKTYIPQGYAPCLNLYDTQKAIAILKRLFEDTLGGALHLRRVSAPLFVEASTGLNDDLNGVERAVSFDIPAAGHDAQVVHSLAKWKRMALYRYQFSVGEGLYTDMNAIRRDEQPDNLHSVYVDQWDWEKVIAPRDRTVEYLQTTVRTIVDCLCKTQSTLRSMFPQLTALPLIHSEVSFVTTQELEDKWPDLTPKEREDAWVKDHPTTFLMGIGGALKSGKPHDGRAPDYDDWSLNGDILLWNPVLERAFEISSMGIRVSPESLDKQLTIAGCDDRRNLPFHKMLLEGKLPLTIGGGIGQSRLCMLLLGKAHIGEVQASVWDSETLSACENAGVILL
ncbi:MAG: aspartate--ammonia ligase [Pseudoflavonifractor capillosus]|uniref:Aspartate--ammonia ligase n=1 Tax=Pseudoflavonifractor capillosus ATCC 29799 TaxID=411467 RepID=A6NPE0_9FIRM|nr:aspartate--ammonia ligase [Pseudoflavonifractor capillosus]EDN02021.1 aspartate--ammonia ligase [Pseudoflavonifractor capillosus ATCC 29799]MCI5927541.1 aspartate--ammonia ligase [Pseudoflavonifractor capillosus]MDY4660956.1 aspartate--ammonia ligase [Pseudoflavonifractor capillosus]SCJ34035.1 Aspartate--ammonia ligase [uncultured Flavonifractor sp.]